jgi:hypothetical protein
MYDYKEKWLQLRRQKTPLKKPAVLEVGEQPGIFVGKTSPSY